MNNEDLDLSQNRVHPEDVVRNARLSVDEKRTLLAAFASDDRAVLGAPTLRQLPNGAVVSLASILKALKELDRANGNISPKAWYTGQRHDKIQMRWRKRPNPKRRRPRDDDDEPPPVPFAFPARALNAAWA